MRIVCTASTLSVNKARQNSHFLVIKFSNEMDTFCQRTIEFSVSTLKVWVFYVHQRNGSRTTRRTHFCVLEQKQPIPKTFGYDMICLLNCNGLPPSGSSTIHLYTHTQTQNNQKQTIRRKTLKRFGKVWAVSRLCELYPGICLTTEEKARTNLSQGS